MPRKNHETPLQAPKNSKIRKFSAGNMSHKKTPFFELRSGNVDTLLFIVKTNDLNALRDELVRRFEATPEFFANDLVAIDVRRLDAAERISIPALAEVLEQARMRPIGVVAGDKQYEWVKSQALPVIELRDKRAVKSTAAAAPPAPHKIDQPEPTMVLDKPLRSGQQIYAKGDLVVLSPISHGAEVIAQGNLYIYAPLRGRALAGVDGKLDARIFCTCLEAELISIAGIYQTAETLLPAHIQTKSVQIRLIDEELVIEPLQLT